MGALHHLYEVTSKEGSLLSKSIKFRAEKQFPFILKLKNNNMLTTFIIKEKTTKRFILDIWDLSKKDGQEHIKEIVLPMKNGTRGIHTMFERSNGEILIVVDDNYGSRILVVDVNKNNGNELIEQFNLNCAGLYSSNFIEDGRYLVTTTGTRINVVRFPLLNLENRNNNLLVEEIGFRKKLK